jgi:hypothetical protein
MTDFAVPSAERRAPIHQRHQNLILIVAGAVMLAVVAAIIYSIATPGTSKMTGLITDDVKGQFVTQGVSCRTIGFKVPTLTTSQIYACDVSGVAQPNRPNGHIHDNTFSRCYIRSHTDQTVDISHALSIEAKLRHKTVPCS